LAEHALAAAPPQEQSSKLARLRVSIPSMDCAACASGIAATLRREPGVVAATIDYPTKLAVIDYDHTSTTRESLLDTIDATGFPADRTSLAK
jgi:mercuric ion binding protein